MSPLWSGWRTRSDFRGREKGQISDFKQSSVSQKRGYTARIYHTSRFHGVQKELLEFEYKTLNVALHSLRTFGFLFTKHSQLLASARFFPPCHISCAFLCTPSILLARIARHTCLPSTRIQRTISPCNFLSFLRPSHGSDWGENSWFPLALSAGPFVKSRSFTIGQRQTKKPLQLTPSNKGHFRLFVWDGVCVQSVGRYIESFGELGWWPRG